MGCGLRGHIARHPRVCHTRENMLRMVMVRCHLLHLSIHKNTDVVWLFKWAGLGFSEFLGGLGLPKKVQLIS